MNIEDIKSAITDNKYKNDILKAQLLQSEMQYFTSSINNSDHEYQSIFEDYIKNRFNDIESKNTFFQNTIYPLHTSTLANKINNELSKMFSGEDANEEHVFKNKSNADNIIANFGIDYLSDKWYDKFCESPNDLMYCHKFEDSYKLKYIELSKLIAIDFDSDDNINYAICKINNDQIIVFDKESTSLYEYKNSNVENIKLIDGGEYNHGIGIAAIEFISSKKYGKSKVIRKNHFYDYVGSFKRLQINATIQNIQDSMSFAHEFNYSDVGCGIKINGTQCQDGFLYAINKENDDEVVPVPHPSISGAIANCPHCNSKSRSFGTRRNVSPPRGESNLNIIESMTTYVYPDVQILEYKDKSIKEQEDNLFNSVLGINETLNDNQQHNEMRVSSVYESRVNVIKKWKTSAEESYKFYNDVFFKFEYKDEYSYTYINLGTKFYLLSESELITKIQLADDSSLDEYTDYRHELICTNFQSNNTERQRALLLLDCEKQLKPFSGVKKTDLLTNSNISKTDLYINLNFNMLFNRFESEFAKNSLTLASYLEIYTNQDVVNEFNDYIIKQVKDEEITDNIQV